MPNLLKAGDNYTLVTRINRKSHSNAGVWVPRRDQEETFGAVVYDPGYNGIKEGIAEGDLVVVRPNCGHDFLLNDPELGTISLTALRIENDEIFGIIAGKGDLDKRSY